MSDADAGVTVLVVDDDGALRSLIKRILETRGYRVVLAANGSEALDAAEADEPHLDVMLVDLSMPGLGGQELAARVRRTRPEMSIVLMSGQIAVDLSRSEPRMAFLAKPFSPDALIAAIVSVLPPGSARG